MQNPLMKFRNLGSYIRPFLDYPELQTDVHLARFVSAKTQVCGQLQTQCYQNKKNT